MRTRWWSCLGLGALLLATVGSTVGCDDWDDNETTCCPEGSTVVQPVGEGGLSVSQEQNVNLFPWWSYPDPK